VLGLTTIASAQPTDPAGDFPRRAVTLVMPGPPGGGPDQVARVIGQFLSLRWGVPVIVDNKPGATGMIGAESVAKAEATGYRLLFTFTALVQAPAVFAKVPYDLERDFAPLTQVANAPVFLAVRADSPMHSLADLIARGRKPGPPLSYGSFGTGSSYHIYGEALRRSQGLNLLHVPYKGEALALADLIGGQIDATFISVGSGAPQVRAEKIRPLAVVAKVRSTILPDVPTFAEAGVNGVDAVGWFGVLAPAATPPAVVAKLAADIRASVQDPKVAARLRDFGFEPVTDSNPQAFRTFLRAETKRWQKLIGDAGIKAE
jgi:tripartite-type tricarboxylate transporter receptor subunit TctC